MNGYSVPSDFVCSTNLCYHWVESSGDAPPLTDANEDGTPDWVGTTSSIAEQVWEHEIVESGYRQPKSDLNSPNHGPDGRLDIYLADIGPDFYGYCTTDDPNASTDSGYQFWDMSAYCVLDNDFSTAQFPTGTPVRNLRVTAAHEFFHAVQMAYDSLEDYWLMEGTATWMEDEVFDSVNDNRMYLSESPLRVPQSPVDRFGGRYGSWIFWRFMSEYFGASDSANPAVIRQVWQRSDGSPGAPDQYSLQAVKSVAAAHDTPFRFFFADFGAINRVPSWWYEEGNAYPSTPVTKSFTLTRRFPRVGWRGLSLDHLTNRYVAFKPGRGIFGAWRLQITVDLPNRSRGSEATALVHLRGGAIRYAPISLNRFGNGSKSVAFSKGSVSKVYLTLTNAGSRYRCWVGSGYSCMGRSLDDGLKHWFRVRAVR